MNRTELVEAVKSIISQELEINVDDMKPETDLAALGIDSLDTLKLAMSLEKEFNIEIETPEIERIRTLEDIVSGLEKKLQ